MLILQRQSAPISTPQPDAIPTENSPQILAIRRDLSSRTTGTPARNRQLRLTDSRRDCEDGSLLTDEGLTCRFNSYAFALFFAALLPAYWLLRKWRPAQNVLLLAAGYYFYACWNPKFLSLLILSTVVDYACGLWLDRVENPRGRRGILALSMALNLGMLGFFKYFNFFAESLHDLLARRARRSRSATSRWCCRSASRSTRSSR